jgi:bifunctional non-homologous end joining protein LigD
MIRRFVLLLGILLEELVPKKVSTSRNRGDRVGKIYIDYFQNGLQKTIAAPFTLRPLPKAPVSFPLEAKNLKKRFQPLDFNIRTVIGILEKTGVPEFDPRPNQTLEGAFAELGASP